MILQELYRLFERLEGDSSYGLPRRGFSIQDVTFEIVLKRNGDLVDIQDTRLDGSPRRVEVPGEGKPPGKVTPASVAKKAGLLWNDASYMLGLVLSGEATHDSLKFAAFRQNHLCLEDGVSDPEFSAVCRFLSQWEPAAEIDRIPLLKKFANRFGTFRIVGGDHYVHDCPGVRGWLARLADETSTVAKGLEQCLVTGSLVAPSSIARTHEPKIKGVGKDRKLLVSFNDPAYTSYGKRQGYNAPVSQVATFQYCNALNALLSGPRKHRHRIRIGDATTVFWTERETVTESIFADFLAGRSTESDDSKESEDVLLRARIESFLRILRKGGSANVSELGDDPTAKFFILGLSGNVTRLSVRFWYAGSIAQMVARLKSHFDALRIQRAYDSDPEFPPAWALLLQTARKSKDIPPLLSGALMQAVLNAGPYPFALYSAVHRRIRADREVTYLRASIIKAVLTRNFQLSIPMSLDTNRTEPAYLLGRLFAALEKTQKEALPGIKATIRERFYSSASATPGAVFPRILRTYQHHLAKLDGGHKVNRERLVQSIHASLASYPPHLDLEGQGLFAIGYYHQQQDFFTKMEKPVELGS